MIKNEIEQIKESLLKDLAALVQIDSSRDELTKSDNAPFGEGVKRAFLVFSDIAKRLGFIVKEVDGYAIYAATSLEEEYVAALGHLDVVEAGDKTLWNSDPFVLENKDGMLYGRGVNDDKGPLLAALYAAYLIKEQGLKLRYPIRIIAGGAEETTWECMDYYFHKQPQPVYGFSPDGNFPIVNGEKGILQVKFIFPGTYNTKISSTHKWNFVCDHLEVIDEEKKVYKGKASLSRNPQRGVSAIDLFVKDSYPFHKKEQSLQNILKMIDEQFLDDFYGEKSGLYAEDKEMGKTSVCLTSLTCDKNMCEVCVDIRYVKSITPQQLKKRLIDIAAQYQAGLEIIKEKRLLYVAPNDPLIISLKRAYERVMQEEAQVLTKGGASYARVLDHGIAFGATFDGEDPKPHMPNECMSIESICKACEIYYEAFLELTK